MALVTEKELDQFRQMDLGPANLLGRIDSSANGICLVNVAVGVGKSFAIDNLIEAAIRSSQYHVVVVLAPTRAIITSRRWVLNPPAEYGCLVLHGRKWMDCPSNLEVQWRWAEARGMGTWAKDQLCGQCPKRKKCPWPQQLGKALQDAQVIFGTQAFLEAMPDFLQSFGADKKILVLLDEIDFSKVPFRRRVQKRHVRQLLEVLKGLGKEQEVRGSQERYQYLTWLLQLDKLMREDVACSGWWFPSLPIQEVLRIQIKGWELFGKKFRYPGYTLEMFGRSPIDTRQISPDGDIEFVAAPWLELKTVAFSATAWLALLQHRLGQAIAPLFSDYRFSHSQSCCYNISSRIGMMSYFPRNAPQILHFFAQLVVRRLREGRRPVLVAKKRLVDECVGQLNAFFESLGATGIQALPGGDWDAGSDHPGQVPVLHYGMIGINSFEHFDAAYCLTGYYAREDIVSNMVQELNRNGLLIPLCIQTQGIPLRRKVVPLYEQDRHYDTPALVQEALDQEELGVVLQAVGRVRPFTRPREVITFQCGQLPGVEYAKEFHSLDEARHHFGLLSQRALTTQSLAAAICQGRQEGTTQAELAHHLGVSLRTVKRHSPKGATKPNSNFHKGWCHPESPSDIADA